MLRCVGLIHNSAISNGAERAFGAILKQKKRRRGSSLNRPRAGRFEMLSRRHCPHTGIVNFFAHAEPLLAVGSVIKAGEPPRYHWRYYLGQQCAVGVAADMRTAENNLINSHREYLRAPSEFADEPPARLLERRSAAARLASGR
jgi:hypothetical protein